MKTFQASFAHNIFDKIGAHYRDAKEALKNIGKNDMNQEYIDPVIHHRPPIREEHQRADPTRIKTTLPERINAPLLPYGPWFDTFVRTRDINEVQNLRGETRVSMGVIYDHIVEYFSSRSLPIPHIRTGVDNVKSFSHYEYSKRANSLHTSAYKQALKSAKMDLDLICDIPDSFPNKLMKPSLGFSILYLINRIRGIASINKEIASSSIYEATVKLGEYDEIIAHCECPAYSYLIVKFGQHCAIWHSQSSYVFMGPATCLDYVYSISDITNNMELISQQPEYSYMQPIMDVITSSIYKYHPHNTLVTFFKSYEGLCLYMADMSTDPLVNWEPIADCIIGMTKLSNKLSKRQITTERAMQMLTNPASSSSDDSLMGKVLNALHQLSPIQLLEASSLHKFLFFAEVSQEQGMAKFLKRTHTKRVVDRENVIQMLSMTKLEFIINYSKKNSHCPPIVSPDMKAAHINGLIKSKDYASLMSMPLAYFDDIKFGKCLEHISAGHPVEFAKDKGSIKTDITFGPKDSVKELVRVMATEDYEAPDFLDWIDTNPQEQVVYSSKTEEDAVPIRFPVRLADKEREARTESRKFGVAPAERKHCLSKYMERAKLFLAYLGEQNMTISDKQRKEDQHDMAQELQDDHTYAVMLDIEGHNQSMQPPNTFDMLEMIGNTFGEEGWGKLSHLFNNLTVYNYDSYTLDTVVSKGQHGGIEGWMNPVWTIITLQQMKLLRYNTTLVIERVKCYSDDVVLIVKLVERTKREVDRVLRIVGKEVFKQGFTVKASQSAVSAYRVTLLRQHSILGNRADATLKRMLAATTANSSDLCSESIEVSAISSVCGSALESSSHILTPTILKWYKSYLVTANLVGRLFQERRNGSIISPNRLPAHIANIYYNIQGTTDSTKAVFSDHISRSVAIFMKRESDPSTAKFSKKQLKAWEDNLRNGTIEEEKSIQAVDVTLYLSMDDEYIQDLWRYILICPESLGGLGLELLINQCMSGNSDGLYKQLYYCHKMISKYKRHSNIFMDAMKYSLKYFDPNDEYSGDTNGDRISKANLRKKVRLISDKWTTNHRIVPARTKVNSALVRVMRQINKNIKLLAVLNYKDLDTPLCELLYEIFKDNFSHRVVQFYHENSIISFVHFLLKKLETSTSLIGRIRRLKQFRSEFATQPFLNVLSLLETSGHNFGNINNKTNILSYLIDRRRAIHPTVNFIDVEEPIYDDMIAPTTESHRILTVYFGDPQEYKNGKLAIKKGHYESTTLYKGEMTDDDVILSAREEMLISKLVAITKWSLLRSEIDVSLSRTDKEYDFVVACNASLSTICDRTFYELHVYVPINIGGEILHRIPNQRFKGKVSTKILPNTLQYINTSLNQTYVLDNELEDTNINFELMRLKLILSYGLRFHYTGELPQAIMFELVSRSNIVIVKDFTPKLIEYRELIKETGTSGMGYKIKEMSRISLNSIAYMYVEELRDTIGVAHEDLADGLEGMIEGRDDKVIIEYYHMMQREHMLLDMDISRPELWQPLIKTLKRTNSQIRESEDEAIMRRVRDTLRTYIDKRRLGLRDAGINRRFSSKFANIREEWFQPSTTYNFLKKMLRINSNSSRDNFVDNIRGKIRMTMRQAENQLFKDVVMDLALGYCMALEATSKDVYLNVDATLENIEMTIREIDFNDSLSANIVFAIEIIGQDRFLKRLSKQKHRLRSVLKGLSDQTSEKLDEGIPINGKIDSSFISSSIDNIPDAVYNVAYEVTEINPNILLDIENLQAFQSTCRTISEMYASPETFYSPTGSDSVVAQYGMAKKLLELGHLSFGEQTDSITSGRGDSLIAFSLARLPAQHYSRPDAFSKVSRLKEVITDYDFDVTKPDTLPFISESHNVWIDISFIKGDLRGLEDLILNCLHKNQRVVLRCNSIEGYSENFIKALIDMDIIVSYAYPSSRGILPYQHYLLFGFSSYNPPDDSIEILSSPVFKDCLRHYGGHISYQRLKIVPETFYENSITSLIDVDIPLEDMIDTVGRMAESSAKVKAIRSLVRDGYYGDSVALDMKTMKHFQQENRGLTGLHQKEKGIDVYSMSGPADCGLEKQKGFKIWIGTLEEVKTGGVGWTYIDLNYTRDDQLKILTRCHPIASVRRWIRTILLFRSHSLNIALLDKEKTEEFHDKVLNEIDTTQSQLSMNVRYCLSVLVSAVAQNDYEWGLQYILGHRSDDEITRKNTSKRLVIYRKMSPLFTYYRRNGDMHRFKQSSLDKIEESLLTPHKHMLKRKKEEMESANKIDAVEEFMSSMKDGADNVIQQLANNLKLLMPQWGDSKGNSDELGLIQDIIRDNTTGAAPDEGPEAVIIDPGAFLDALGGLSLRLDEETIRRADEYVARTTNLREIFEDFGEFYEDEWD
nr:RNA-dependent RNA polymerase [Phlebiopsis gigantea negative-strand virus 1]